MKRRAIELFIIILTFGLLGITATLLHLKLNPSNNQTAEPATNPVLLNNEDIPADLPILSFCELANNPEKYDGKIVRLNATLTFGLEGSWFSDSNCGSHDNGAIVSSASEEVWNPLKQARERKGEKFSANQLNVTAVGKFKNEVYKDCCLIAPFQFEISKVEKASTIN
ncbi:MAG TPA: hypothetical protein VF599_15245 [Pyrinomonadaceae bacterium]